MKRGAVGMCAVLKEAVLAAFGWVVGTAGKVHGSAGCCGVWRSAGPLPIKAETAIWKLIQNFNIHSGMGAVFC